MRIIVRFSDFIPNNPIEFLLFFRKSETFSFGSREFIEIPAILCYNQQPITLRLPAYPVYYAIRKMPVHIQQNILNGITSVLISKTSYRNLQIKVHKEYSQ